jgi:biopolymer transport protein ExbD
VVLVARFVDQERLDVTLPSADAGRPAEIDALMVEMNKDGEVFIEGREIADGELHDTLLGSRRRFNRAVLLADRDAALQDAVDVISAAKLAGFKGVALATRPPQ